MWFWIARYAVQDLGSKAVALTAGALAAGAGMSNAPLAGGVAALEIASFYLIAFWRRRRAARTGETRRASLFGLLREYGPAEFVDVLIRPVALNAGLAASSQALVGLLVGSVLADLAFYAAAIVAARRLGVVPPRDRGEANRTES